jgi:hypothetical protein
MHYCKVAWAITGVLLGFAIIMVGIWAGIYFGIWYRTVFGRDWEESECTYLGSERYKWKNEEMFYHQVKVSVKDGDSYYPGYA